MSDSVSVDLGRRAKVMRNPLGIRPTVAAVPRRLLVWLVDPVIKFGHLIGDGYRDYDNDTDFRTSRPAPPEPTSDDWNSSESVFLLNGLDEWGRTVTVNVTGTRFPLYVQCPDSWTERETRMLASFFEDKYRLPHGALNGRLERRRHLLYWEPDPRDATKSRMYNYCLLEFPSTRVMGWCARHIHENSFSIDGLYIRPGDLQLHEAGIDRTQKALERSLPLQGDGLLRCTQSVATPCAWFEVTSWRIPHRYFTHSQIEVEATVQSIRERLEIETVPPILEASFDVESNSHDGQFPSPEERRNFTICVNTFLKWHGEPPPLPGGAEGERMPKEINVCHHFGPVAPVDDVTIYRCPDELTLLETWRDTIVLDAQPLSLHGYNTELFDNVWVATRAALLSDPRAPGVGDDSQVPPQPAPAADESTQPCVAEAYRCQPNPHDPPCRLGLRSRLFYMGMLIDEHTPLSFKDLDTSAKGDNRFFLFHMTGRVGIDMWRMIKDDYKLTSYGLNDVCEFFFPDDPTLRKMPISPEEIWGNYAGDVHTRAVNVKYCAKDCELALRLSDRVQTLTSFIEFARLTRTPIRKIVVSGQTVKTFNLLVFSAHQMNMVVNLPYEPPQRGPRKPREPPKKLTAAQKRLAKQGNLSYEGATVLDPIPGAYDVPIVTLDFASLYPSIMEANKLCPSTLVNCPHVVAFLRSLARFALDTGSNTPREVPAEPAAFAEQSAQDGLNTLYMSDSSWRPDSESPSTVAFRQIRPSPTTTHVFVQHVEGVMPRMLAELKRKRAEVRAKQKNYKEDSLEWKILDVRQLNLKLQANASYGFYGVKVGFMPLKQIAESVTCIGREMIVDTKTCVEQHFAAYTSGMSHAIVALVVGVKVIYGDTDSVMIKFQGLPSTQEGVALSLAIAKKAAAYVTARFPKQVKLEVEKSYWPFVLFKKKRYAGVMWTMTYPGSKDAHRAVTVEIPEEDPSKNWKMMILRSLRADAKGVEVKRRDNWLGLRDTYKQCLDAMLMKNDLELAKVMLLTLLSKISNDELPLEAYIVSKSLKKDYSRSRTLPPHVVVRNKIQTRNPGSEPKSGNRVPFVITEDRGERLIANRAEDPDYVRQSGGAVKIDRRYYLRTLKKPFCTLMEPCFEDPKALFREHRAQLKNQQMGRQEITNFLVRRSTGKRPGDETQEERIARIAAKVKKRREDTEYVPEAVRAKQKREKKRAHTVERPTGPINSWLKSRETSAGRPPGPTRSRAVASVSRSTPTQRQAPSKPSPFSAWFKPRPGDAQ